GLIGLGVRPGERVAILAKNSFAYVVAYFAASKAGAVLVPLNYRHTPADWVQVLNDADARVLLVGPDFAGALASVQAGLTMVRHIVALGPEPPTGWLTYAGLLADQPSTAPELDVPSDTDLMMLYTSGTTG